MTEYDRHMNMYDKSQSNKQDDVLRLGRKTVDSKIKALRGKEDTRRGGLKGKMLKK